MVDFNNENTITTAPKDIIKILFLERRKYVIDAIEDYYKREGKGFLVDPNIIYSRLLALYYELEPVLMRSLKEKDKEILKSLLQESDIKNSIKAFQIINNCMDEKKLTRVDLFKEYDRTDTEAENMEHGF